MTEVHRINDQLERAQNGEAWHGPSLREALEGVTAAQAAAHAIPQAHSIWELVSHIIAWEQIARRRLGGETLTEIPEEMDFPAVSDKSNASWQATLQALAESNQLLCAAVRQIEDAQLELIVPGTRYSNYVLLHGVIQHDLYHAGQIAVLKKSFV